MRKTHLPRTSLLNLFTIMELIGLLIFSFGSKAYAIHPIEYCEHLLNQPFMAQKEDLEIFEKSDRIHVISGGIKATKAHALINSYIKENDLVNRWYVHFVGEEQRDLFDSPSLTLKNISERMNRISTQRADLGNFGKPVRVFFMSGASNYIIAGQRQHFFNVRSTDTQTQSRYIGSDHQLRLFIEGGFKSFNFHETSDIILIGSGDHYHASHWQDDFILAREISSPSVGNNVPEYFRLAVTNLKAFQITGLTTSLADPEVNVIQPTYLNLNTLFDKFYDRANHKSMGALLTPFLHKVWLKISDLKLPTLYDSLLHRTEELLRHTHSDTKGHMKFSESKTRIQFSKEQAAKELNFLAAISIQASVELQSPLELTEWLCDEWERLGAKGPFHRYRIYDSTPQGRTLSEFDKKQQFLVFPENWRTCDELVNHLQDFAPRHQPPL